MVTYKRTAQPMKCAEDHSTHLCEKPVTTPPKCCKCEGERLAISLRCNKNPNNPRNKNENKVINVWQKREEERQIRAEEKSKKQVKAESTKDVIQKMLDEFNRKVVTLIKNLNYKQDD